MISLSRSTASAKALAGAVGSNCRYSIVVPLSRSGFVVSVASNRASRFFNALQSSISPLAGLDGDTVQPLRRSTCYSGRRSRFGTIAGSRRRCRSSRLPVVKTLADFDFSFQPSVKREQLESLHTLCFSERKENVVFLGPSGVGRTHLAISLAIAAAESGRRVYYGTLGDLIAWLEEAQQDGRLLHRLRKLVFPSHLIVDEIGYLPISRTGAILFFQLMSRRDERAATVLTSNKGFEEWGEIFGDDVMAAALIDRLVHHCHNVNIRGNSYRMRHHTELHRALGSPRHTPAEPLGRALGAPGHASSETQRTAGPTSASADLSAS